MRLAIWDDALVRTLSEASDLLRTSGIELGIVDRNNLLGALQHGEADIALVPTLQAILHADELDLFPAVAWSSWANPFYVIALGGPLGTPVSRIAYSPGYEQEAFMAHVLIKEHYGFVAELVEVNAALEREETTVVIHTHTIPQEDAPVLDLGQEWYELAQYPMVWGLFASLKGQATEERLHQLIEVVEAAAHHKPSWLTTLELNAAAFSFYSDHERLRLDDLATASLTSFQDFLFFYNRIPDMNPFPFVTFDTDTDSGPAPMV